MPRYYPRIYLSKSGASAPSVRPPIVFLQMPHPPPSSSSPSLLAIRPSSNTSSNANRRLFLASVGSTSRQSGGTPSSSSSSLFWLAAVGLVIIKMAGVPEVDVLRPYRLLGLGESPVSGMTFLGRGKESRNRKRSGFRLNTRKRMWIRKVVESYRRS